MKFPILLIYVAFVWSSFAASSENFVGAIKAPALIELPDQFDKPQRLAFPMTNVVALTIADHKGSEEIGGWVAALKSRYHDRIAIHGIADVRRAPGFLRNRVQKKFQATEKHSVMMDWSGSTCATFNSKLGVANIFIISTDGTIVSRHLGPATEESLETAYARIDGLLSKARVRP